MGYLRRIVQSSTDFSFYRGIINDPPLKTLRYFCFVSLLVSLFAFARTGAGYIASADEYLRFLGERLEGLKISGGALVENRAARPQTFILGALALKIAPALSVEEAQKTEFSETVHMALTLLDENIVIRQKSAAPQIISLAAVGSFDLNARAAKRIRLWFALVFSLFFVFFSALLTFAVRLIKAFIVSDIVYLLFVKRRLPELRPANRMNIGVYAIVPSAVVEIFASTNTLLIPYIPYITLAMFCAFVFGAYTQIKGPERETQSQR